MFKISFSRLILMIAFFLQTSFAKADLVIGGDDANISLIEIFVRHFESQAKHGHVKIIPTLGSKGGIAALNDRKIQIAMVTRLLSQVEETFNFTSVPYAKSCLVFVANPSVTTKDVNLSTEDLENIFEEKKTKWSDNKPIQVIFQTRGDSGVELLMIQFPKLKQAFEKAWNTGMWRTEIGGRNSLALLEKINQSFGWINQSELIASKSPARLLQFNGVLPQASLIETKKYPLVEVSTLVYKEPASQEVKDFIALVKSEMGVQILRQNEAVPIR